jgi:hypothetical protein
LRCIWDGELITNAFTIKILFDVGVLELGAIVTSYSLDLYIKHILRSSKKLLEYALNFTLVFQEEYPSVSRVLVNNDKSILFPPMLI